jgi:hypothetical protein
MKCPRSLLAAVVVALRGLALALVLAVVVSAGKIEFKSPPVLATQL